MIIHITHRELPFAQIDKRVLGDPRLSWQATGLLSYLLGKPDDWRVNTRQLVSAKRNGRDAVRKMLHELVDAGYAKLVAIQGEDGKMRGKVYVVSEAPGSWDVLPHVP